MDDAALRQLAGLAQSHESENALDVEPSVVPEPALISEANAEEKEARRRKEMDIREVTEADIPRASSAQNDRYSGSNDYEQSSKSSVEGPGSSSGLTFITGSSPEDFRSKDEMTALRKNAMDSYSAHDQKAEQSEPSTQWPEVEQSIMPSMATASNTSATELAKLEKLVLKRIESQKVERNMGKSGETATSVDETEKDRNVLTQFDSSKMTPSERWLQSLAEEPSTLESAESQAVPEYSSNSGLDREVTHTGPYVEEDSNPPDNHERMTSFDQTAVLRESDMAEQEYQHLGTARYEEVVTKQKILDPNQENSARENSDAKVELEREIHSPKFRTSQEIKQSILEGKVPINVQRLEDETNHQSVQRGDNVLLAGDKKAKETAAAEEERDRIIYEYERKKVQDAQQQKLAREELILRLRSEENMKGPDPGMVQKAVDEYYKKKTKEETEVDEDRLRLINEYHQRKDAREELLRQRSSQEMDDEGPVMAHELQAREELILQLRLEEEKQKQKDKAEYEAFLRKQQEKELDESMRKRLKQLGYSDNQVDDQLQQEKQEETQLVQTPPTTQPTYAKVHRSHLDIKTLHYYDIPYEYDQDPNYVIVLREMNDREREILFEHTRRLRSGAKEKRRKKLAQAAPTVEAEFSREDQIVGSVPPSNAKGKAPVEQRQEQTSDLSNRGPSNLSSSQSTPEPLPCYACGLRFVGTYRRSNLKRHVRNEHTDEAQLAATTSTPRNAYYESPDDEEDEEPAHPISRRRQFPNADNREGRKNDLHASRRTRAEAAEDYVRDRRDINTDENHEAARRLPGMFDESSDSESSDNSRRSARQGLPSSASGEIRMRVDASKPLSLSFNGDMEGRSLQLVPAEDGMADVVIGPHETSYNTSDTKRSRRPDPSREGSTIVNNPRGRETGYNTSEPRRRPDPSREGSMLVNNPRGRETGYITSDMPRPPPRRRRAGSMPTNKAHSSQTGPPSPTFPPTTPYASHVINNPRGPKKVYSISDTVRGTDRNASYTGQKPEIVSETGSRRERRRRSRSRSRGSGDDGLGEGNLGRYHGDGYYR